MFTQDDRYDDNDIHLSICSNKMIMKIRPTKGKEWLWKSWKNVNIYNKTPIMFNVLT